MNATRRHLLQTALALGAAPAFSRFAFAADVDRFPLGLASGCPRPGGVVLWTRLIGTDLPEQVAVQWELASDEGFRQIVAKGTETAEAAWAHSIHAEPTGLSPGRWYWYRFTAMGSRSITGRTRTAPAPDAGEPLRFATASCQRWDHGEYAAWRDMATQELDLVLFLGDYIYEYAASSAPAGATRRHSGGAARSLDDYRARHAQYKSDPYLRAMHARAPWIITWDDHEIANDYAPGRAQDLDPNFEPRRAAATQAYWEHLPFPKSARPRGTETRIHAHYDWGSLARLITLDNRQWRDPQACPKPGRAGSNTVYLKDCEALRDPRRSLLGGAQERWLAQSWDASRPWNLLGQQSLMARYSWTDPAGPNGPQYWTEGWDGYPLARQRLLGDMLAAKAGNPVVLGGDVHANYVADLKQDFDAAKAATIATEFCGTSISSHGLANDKVQSALPWNTHLHYARSDQRGYTLFDLNKQRLTAELRTVDDAMNAQSPVSVEKRFVVEAGKPGSQSA
ncbi:MAG: alkaline phosphatase D family protein [Burkholderiaceae bacterium]|nr:alkaline phosphatase D family protein [Burkholderiaceae bacterium]